MTAACVTVCHRHPQADTKRAHGESMGSPRRRSIRLAISAADSIRCRAATSGSDAVVRLAGCAGDHSVRRCCAVRGGRSPLGLAWLQADIRRVCPRGASECGLWSVILVSRRALGRCRLSLGSQGVAHRRHADGCPRWRDGGCRHSPSPTSWGVEPLAARCWKRSGSPGSVQGVRVHLTCRTT